MGLTEYFRLEWRATKAPARNCLKRTENYIGSETHFLEKREIEECRQRPFNKCSGCPTSLRSKNRLYAWYCQKWSTEEDRALSLCLMFQSFSFFNRTFKLPRIWIFPRTMFSLFTKLTSRTPCSWSKEVPSFLYKNKKPKVVTQIQICNRNVGNIRMANPLL